MNRDFNGLCTMKKAPHMAGLFLLRQNVSGCQPRESSDIPRLNAFCRVAPSLRFNVRAMLDALVFLRANVFSVRRSDDVHGRRFDFRAIQ
jgi:hypothetical protein